MMAEFWAVLNSRQRYQLGLLLAVFIVNALFEFLSLGVVFALAISVIAPADSFGAQKSIVRLLGPGFMASTQAKAALAGAVVVAFLLKSIAGVLTTWLRARIIHEQNTVFAERLLRSYLAKGWPFFLRNNTAMLTAQITNTCNEFTNRFINGGAVFMTELCVCLALFAGLAFISPMAMLILGAAMVVLIAGLHRSLRRWMYRFGDQDWAARMNAARTVETALHGAKEVILYHRAEAFCDELHEDLEIESRAGAMTLTLNDSPRQVIEFSAVAGFIGFLGVEALVGHSLASVGVLASVFAAAGFRLLPAASRLASAGAAISNMKPYFDQLKADLVLVPRVDKDGAAAIAFEAAIELKSVRFRYPEAATDALSGLSARIAKGESVGIVGRSGAGKTTLMELLLGVLAPTDGDILIDGRPLGGALLDGWQDLIGYVPQQVYLSDDTIARNIAFGIPKGEIDLERVREAARLAGIADFIETETPDGYQTEVGDEGMTLSGGQRQRVVIARALYRRPQVLVFDEATSALDHVTENIVNEAIARLQGEKTVLIVAHRLSSVRHCANILVLDQGRLVQQGSFNALSRQTGVFRTLIQAMEKEVADTASKAEHAAG